MFSEVVKVLEQAESEKHVSSLKIDVGFGGSISKQGIGCKLLASPLLTTNTQNNLLPQATLQMDNVVPEKDSKSFPLFGTSAERVSSFAISSNGLSDSKPSPSSDPKELESTRSQAVTPSVPFLFGSGTTSILSSTFRTSPFLSSASTKGTSLSFGISSRTASSKGKYCNTTSGPATSIFGSTWDPTKFFEFGTTSNFGAFATPTPSATTSPVVFGASSTSGSTRFSFGVGTQSSVLTPTQNQSPFGTLTPAFASNSSKTLKAIIHNEFIDTPDGSVYWVPKVSSSVLPVLGTVYDSLDECIEIYRKYTSEAGFGIRLSCQKRLKYGYVKQNYVVYNREWCPKDVWLNTLDPKKNDRQYILTTFDVEHNHELDRVEYKQLSKAERKLTYNDQLFIIKVANANIGVVRAHNLYTGLKGSSSLVR
nr:hypothetical protein [Tanacetum cinerariifolium]